jgi:hypothetical protein
MDSKAKIVVVYFGAGGLRDCRLTLCVAEGAWDAGAEVRVRCVHRLVVPESARVTAECADLLLETEGVAEATAADLEWADAAVFGTATARSATPNDGSEPPGAAELAAAREEGRRLAETVHALKSNPSRLAVVA